jgi:hypothetical protein
MSLLYFVIPAFGRYDLTGVCLDQKLDVVDQLAAHGLDVRCVVVADDANLELARERGMDTVEAPNVVSDKFNAGMAHAGANGADWIVPIGSDSWIDPSYLRGLHSGTTRTAAAYCHVLPDRIGVAKVNRRAGVGPYVFGRKTLEPCGFRPAKPGMMRNVDSATVRGIEAAAGPLNWRRFDLHPLQYVGFRVAPFITHYENLMQAHGVRELNDPWRRLAEHYPQDLVDRAHDVVCEVVAA